MTRSKPTCDRKAEPCDDPTCTECCEHDEHDHGFCLDCGADVTDRLIMDAEAAFEGDR